MRFCSEVVFFVFKHKHYHAFLIVSAVKKIMTEPISDFSESSSSDSECDPNPKFYNDDMKLPVLEWGMKQGMHTKDAVQILREFPEKRVASAVPIRVQHNVAFVVDSWKLKNIWDVKCDDMGSWANQGRKTFKKGKMDDDYNVYRQSYFNANLPSLKKYLVYLANDNGETYRYLFLQYVFTEGETAVHIQSHGNSKQSSSHKEYKQTMPSTMEAIREGKGIPREIMHAIIDDRGVIDNVRSSGEYLRDRGQIYHAHSKSNNRSDNSYPSTDPPVELLQILKSQQRGNKEHWFVRDVNFSNEQTVLLANDQQLLDVQRFCTSPELFSVFLANATFNVANHYFTFGTYRNLILETQQGTNPICIGPGVLHKRKLEESYYTLPSLMVKYKPETRGVLVVGTDDEENIWMALNNVFLDALHLRCDIHLKDNVKQKLSELAINSKLKLPEK